MLLSCFSRVQLFETLCAVDRQAPLSMGFFRQEYWSGLPCPPPGDLPDPGTEPASPMVLRWQAGSLPLAPPGKVTLFISLHFSLPAWEVTEGTVRPSTSWASGRSICVKELCQLSMASQIIFVTALPCLRGAAELKIRILYGINGFLESCKQIRFLKIQSLQHLVMAPFRGTQQRIINGGRRSAAKQIVLPY